MSFIASHGGVNEIGGHKLLLEAGELRIFCYSGKHLGRCGSFCEGVFVRQRYAGSLVPPLNVRQAPGDCLLTFSLTDVADLLDIECRLTGKPGGTCVFSNRQANDDEQMVDLGRLSNWTDQLGMRPEGLQPHREERGTVGKATPVDGYPASGRAAPAEPDENVRHGRPRLLIAIHTENVAGWQDRLRGMSPELVIPECAEPIQL
jgi:hypothetical protein